MVHSRKKPIKTKTMELSVFHATFPEQKPLDALASNTPSHKIQVREQISSAHYLSHSLDKPLEREQSASTAQAPSVKSLKPTEKVPRSKSYMVLKPESLSLFQWFASDKQQSTGKHCSLCSRSCEQVSLKPITGGFSCCSDTDTCSYKTAQCIFCKRTETEKTLTLSGFPRCIDLSGCILV
jgi:hypothetical protein